MNATIVPLLLLGSALQFKKMPEPGVWKNQEIPISPLRKNQRHAARDFKIRRHTSVSKREQARRERERERERDGCGMRAAC